MSGNTFYHNTFIHNANQATTQEISSNAWDNGAEGNYWADYSGVDVYSGPYQNETGSDGIGDTPYIIGKNNQDRCPLISTRIFKIGPLTRFGVVWERKTYYIDTISNSTVEEFHFSQSDKQIGFNVTGPEDTTGFCNVTIPKNLLKAVPPNNWTVLLDGMNITANARISENATHTFIYFTYTHNNHKAQIIGTWVVPEFSTWIISLLTIAILSLVTIAIALHKRGIGKQ